MLCFLYTIALGTCLAIAGLLAERALPPNWPRRWIWSIIIGLSMTIPPFYQAGHNVSVPANASTLEPSWWVRIGSHDPMLMRLWVIASGALFVWGLVSAWQISRAIRRSRSGKRSHYAPATVDGVAVVVTESLGPATVGLWRSRVLMPYWVLTLPRAQRQYILRHEDEHRRANDARLLFLTSLCLVLTPWNVALWWQLRRLSLAVEMDCDNRVVDALGDATSYGKLLLTVAESTNPGPRLQPALMGRAGMLERRLRMLLAPKQLPRAMRYLLSAAAIGILLLAASTPHPKVGLHHDQHSTNAGTVNPRAQQ